MRLILSSEPPLLPEGAGPLKKPPKAEHITLPPAAPAHLPQHPLSRSSGCSPNTPKTSVSDAYRNRSASPDVACSFWLPIHHVCSTPRPEVLTRWPDRFRLPRKAGLFFICIDLYQASRARRFCFSSRKFMAIRSHRLPQQSLDCAKPGARDQYSHPLLYETGVSQPALLKRLCSHEMRWRRIQRVAFTRRSPCCAVSLCRSVTRMRVPTISTRHHGVWRCSRPVPAAWRLARWLPLCIRISAVMTSLED